MRTCEQSNCTRRHYAKGLCSLHYKRHSKGSDLSSPLIRSGSLSDRFWVRVDKSLECWTWRTGLTAQGYGQIREQGRSYLAHRLSYEWHYGAIPDGMQVDHICRSRSCVNPDHLRLATDGLNKQNLGGERGNSKSGIRGVSWNRSRKKWVARGAVDGRVTQLGYFSSIEKATTAITEWRRENMPYSVMDQSRKESA